MARYITSAAVWTAIALITALWLPLMAVVFLVTAPFDPGRYAVGRLFRLAAVISVKINPFWDFRVSGVRITDPRRPYVAVSNHESLLDIFLISHLPWEMKWVSKIEVFRIPVMGWMMRLADDICVRRNDPRSRAKALAEIKARLARRVSVMIFPEGTRSPRGGDLLPFHDGAFRAAIETGLPILPMVVAGTRDAMAKGSLLIRRARAEVRVLDPIETAHLTSADVAALRDRVRAVISDARRELTGSLAGA
jgi:1-acyl-sn-glycerol-3-phosphate acyltransferase